VNPGIVGVVRGGEIIIDVQASITAETFAMEVLRSIGGGARCEVVSVGPCAA
jgi:hypothetical protein